MKNAQSNVELNAAKQWLKQQKALAGNSLTISIVLSIISGLLLIAQAALLAYIVNQVIFLDIPWQNEVNILLVLLLIVGCRAFLTKYTELFAVKGANKIKLTLRAELYNKLVSLGPSYIANKQSAQLAELLNQGVDALEAYYARYLPAVAFCAIIPLSILAIILPIDWLTGLIFLCTAPLVPVFMILIGLKAESLNQKHWQQLTRMSNHFLDVIQGLSQLKLFNASREEGKAIASISDKYRRSTMSILKIAFLSSFALEFLATLSIALVAVTVGFRLYWGELDFAVGFMLLLLAPEFYLPFRNLGTQYHAKMKGVAAAQQMLELLNSKPIKNGNELLNTVKNNDYVIDYKDVCFTYEDGRTALININFTLNGKGLYAVIGQSGAGKSTLIDLLLGFLHPSHGQIDINQQSLNKIQRKEWLKKLAWVPQNPQLIYGTVLENIQLADPSASIQDVKKAAHKAGVDQFVEHFENGWQHIIAEQGAGISGGQKQRIAMARVFLKHADILILDEPSAHLDTVTEQWLTQAIADYAKQHCVIVVAHRLQSIKQAKSILLLENGSIAAQGDHQYLVENSPLYNKLIIQNQRQSILKKGAIHNG